MRRTWAYSLFAGAMLVAFVNMMAVKDLHHHEHDCSHACCLPSDEPTLSQSDDDCPICQFTIVPQSAQTFKPVFTYPQAVVMLRAFLYISYTAVTAEIPSSRAPPVC